MTEPALPLPHTGVVASVWASLTNEQRQALLPHLLGDTSANWLSRELTRAGLPIGATSIKQYRQTIREDQAA